MYEEKCQCPQSGSSHFYDEDGELAWIYTKRVNALNRAHPISTMHCKEILKTQGVVSMPSIGLIPFLQESIMGIMEEVRCVNALNRAHPISTRKKLMAVS